MGRNTSARRNLAGYGSYLLIGKVLLGEGFLKKVGNRGHEMPKMMKVYTYKYKATTMTKGTL
jgi:hypothetical protein